ncbi:ARM repeat-containing protein [Microstroma glucosiphilum]|uniref:ARM repeat-containing protein n=1 Tax=Pseudomicrostroma glucosiphilum TaxID=1684307 RepID=A0A316TWH2_9BASI|nr:ARM repeat-containing protein [Pseudomicrostroma glucosiphilum]PWN17789.1 ARM repeat-containing protein [Pseudomicrostroma glucosiphilum]
MDEFGGMGGSAPPEEDFSRIPVEERLAHKNWKARSSAYEELSKKFSTTAYDSDPAFRPYTRNPDLLKGMLTDANAVAQEKGVGAVVEFVKYGGKAAGSTREAVFPAVTEKCLGSTRAGTKKAALELALLYAENEDVMGCEGLVNDILPGLSAKQPKLVAASVTALAQLIKEFGPKQVRPNPIMKKLPDIFAHSDKTVRAEASILSQELHRYIGAALTPTIDSLKDIQAKELRAQFEEIDRTSEGKPVPPRSLLSQRAAVEAAAAGPSTSSGGSKAPGGASTAAEDAGEFDPYELAEAVDPFAAKAWPQDFDEAVRSSKWAERKDALEAAKGVLSSNIKLQSTPAFDPFIDACLERIRKDVTIHVWLMACQCLEAAAKGLRGSFAKYREQAMPLLLEKLKEKKPAAVEAISGALDAIFQTVTVSDVLGDILTATKHKNPAVKTESIRFLVRCLRTTVKPPAKADIKPVADALVAACSDSSGDVRDAGLTGLGTLMKLIGERPMNPYLEELDDIKKARVQEEFSTAQVKVRMGGAAPPAARPAAAAPSAKPVASKPAPRVVAKAPTAEKENAPPMGLATPAKSAAAPRPQPRPVARPAAPPTSAASRPAALAAKAGASKAAGPSRGVAGAPSVNEPVKFRFMPEEAEAKAAQLIPAEFTAQLADSNWKERLAGIQAFAAWLDREAETIESEVIVRALSKKPGWKESNFQVAAEVFKVFRLLAEQCPTFGRASVALTVQPLVDKLGDIKLKAPANETLGAYSEKTSFGFVLKQALGPLAALKAPKSIADSLTWIDTALLEFGLQGVDVKSLVDHLLVCLKSANAAVRNNATTTMGTLARFLGVALNTFIADLNPQLKTTIEAEIGKAASNPPPPPTRFSAELRPVGGAADDVAMSGADAAADEEDALDALIPRVDVDKLLPSSAIASMGDASWKIRKESLEEIQSILEANTRLKGTLSDVTPALKLRFTDANVQCKTLALDITLKLAKGLGKAFEPQTKSYTVPVTGCLSDAKVPVRQAALATLTTIADAVGPAAMISGFANALESKGANPTMKQDLFTWLSERFEASPPDKSYDLAPLAMPAVQCLDDKLAAVKKAAQATLPYIIQRAGYKFVASQADGMKVASKNTVQPLIEQARAAASALGPAKTAAAPAAAPISRATVPGVKRVAASAAPARPSSPAARAMSPAPASPRANPSAASRSVSGMRPPSAATRLLQPTSAPRSAAAPPSGLSKPGFSSRLGAAKKAVMVPASGATSSSYASGSAGGIPFLTSDPKFKAIRERKDNRGQYWISAEGTPRPDLVEVLRAQCEGQLGATLIDQMFSKDHNAERDYLSALALLSDFISSPTFAEEEHGVAPAQAVAMVVANSDLIFKYIAIRLTDNNTSISLKCFDVLLQLMDLLRAEQYRMGDYEANSILPCLIAKFGDAKIAFRDRIRDAFRKVTFVFPPSKLMTQYLDNGLPSKNARTRSECLAELGYLFSKNGLQVCTPSKTLPVIAKQISDRDTNVRTAALLALGECYKIVGDDVWALVGKLPEKELSLLEERLKRTTVSRSGAATPASPRPSVTPPTNGKPASGIPGMKSRLPSATSGIARTIPRPSAVATSVASPPASPAPQRTFSSRSESAPEEVLPTDDVDPERDDSREEYEDGPDFEQTINEILSSEPERSTIALKAIHNEMQEDARPFAAHADLLANVLAKQYSRAFKDVQRSEVEDAAYTRLKKYLIQVSSSLFDAKMKSEDGHTLASYIQKQALAALMTQMLQRLIDSSHRSKEDEEARTYATYLNKIVIRCFGSCNLNVLYSTSFAMLTDASEDLRELSGPMLKTRADFAELIIKCLWKVGRRLPVSLAEEGIVDPAQLMADMEAVLQRIPPTEWKARHQDGIPLSDLPYRTIKVNLSHLVQRYGEEVLSHLDQLENPEDTYIYGHLVRMLNQTDGGGNDGANDELVDSDAAANSKSSASLGAASRAASANHLNGSSSSGSASALPSQGSQDLADSGINAELKDIFERISQKEKSRKAIKDLYEFQKRYPHKANSIERSLQSTGPIFQRYIKRALANHAAEDEGAEQAGEAGSGSASASASARGTPNGEEHHVEGNGEAAAGAGLSRPTSTTGEDSATGTPRRPSSHLRQTSSSYANGSGSTHGANASMSGTGTGASAGATDDRLAQLRAKFYNRTPSSPSTSGSVAAAAGEATTTGVAPSTPGGAANISDVD